MDKIKQKIKKLSKDLDAVILVHNYQLPDVQDIADFVGDSLELSIKASITKAKVIIFCGVYFMAETAKILSPEKKVIIPDKNAGCPMADMITVDQLRDLKAKNPEAKVLCYVNSSAEVKAESDVCCTSANAVQIAQKAFGEKDQIIFVPDKYLAEYTASCVNRKFIFWPGYCPTHAKIIDKYIIERKKEYPDAEVLSHPECSQAVIKVSDKVLSTGGMIRYVKGAKTKRFIIATETDMLYRLKNENPDKEFYPASDLAVCPNMKKITLDKVITSLETGAFEVELDDDIIEKAQKSIRKMLDYS